MIGRFFRAMRVRAQVEAELRRFHDAELREIGVSQDDIDSFLGRRR